MQRLVAALANKENIERYKSVIALEEFGEPAAEYLIQALSDEGRGYGILPGWIIRSFPGRMEPCQEILKNSLPFRQDSEKRG